MDFISVDNVKKRGVVFYINPALEPKLIQKDEKGRILIVLIKIREKFPRPWGIILK